MSGARPDPRASRAPAENVRAKAAVIAVAAAVPGWLTKAVALALVLRVDGGPDLAGVVHPAAAARPRVDGGAVVRDHARPRPSGPLPADQWWAAGALFVLADAVATVVVEAPVSAEAVLVALFTCLLTGSWLVMFAAGAGAWHRLAPPFMPLSWTNLPPEDE